MQITISRQDLSRVVKAAGKVVESRTTIPILSSLLLSAENDTLTVTATDLDIVATTSCECFVKQSGRVCVDAKLLTDIAGKAGAPDISLAMVDGRLEVKSGRSKFNLAVIGPEDFPTLDGGTFDAEFDIDLASLFAPVAFAISNEATRIYLNGIFFHNIDGKAVAVATDGHRLAKNVGVDAPAFPSVIVPQKTVSVLPRGTVQLSVSESRIRIASVDLTIVSKLIDGTFPDYQRVIPANNDKVVTVDREGFLKAADRVVTVSSEKSRAVKLSIADGAITFTARSEVGEASDEIATAYDGDAIEVGYNSQYLKDMLGVLPSGEVALTIADAGSPALVTGGLDGWTGVLMPVRV